MLKRILNAVSSPLREWSAIIAEKELKEAIERYKQRRERLRHFSPSIIIDFRGRKSVKWEERPIPLNDKEVDEAMKVQQSNLF